MGKWLDEVFYEFRGQTALHKAAWYKRKSVCQLLVEYGASILSVDNNGDTAISLCRKSDDSDLEMFLSGKFTIFTHLYIWIKLV